MTRQFSGLKIRNERKRRKLSQKELAEIAGISATYLNLIEHEKRNIAGHVMNSIAQALSQPVDFFLKQDFSAQYEALCQKARADVPDLSSFEALANAHPEWVGFIEAEIDTSTRQSLEMEKMSARINNDPYLETGLHELITKVTSIRSAVSILNTHGDMSAAKQSHFMNMLHTESREVTDTIRGLIQHLENQVGEEVTRKA